MNDNAECSIRDESPYMRHSEVEHEWKGLTVFYNDIDKEVYYLDTPAGLVPLLLDKTETREFKAYFDQWNAQEARDIAKEVYLLQLKASGRELDPRHFDAQEKDVFSEADAKEWAQWLKNGVVKVLTAQEEKEVPKGKIFSAPTRYVRTMKGTDLAKSRIVIPGHKDPEFIQCCSYGLRINCCFVWMARRSF